MSLEAARRLLLAHRPELAEREVRRWLAGHPDDADAHSLLAWSLALQPRARADAGVKRDAVAAAEEGVRLAPESADAHAALGEVLLRLGDARRAEKPLRYALELEPHEPQHHAMLAAALLEGPSFFRGRKALKMAEAGLALDADHAACARVRALALIQMLRFRKARHAAAFALRLEPENSYGHAVSGWAQLLGGNRVLGREHLREALRADPENRYAEAGLYQADQSLRLCAGMEAEVARSPLWLRAAAALHAAGVAAALAWGDGAGVLPDLVGSLGFLVVLELLLVQLHLTRRGRELCAGLLLSDGERKRARVGLVLLVGAAVLLALAPTVEPRLSKGGEPRAARLP